MAFATLSAEGVVEVVTDQDGHLEALHHWAERTGTLVFVERRVGTVSSLWLKKGK